MNFQPANSSQRNAGTLTTNKKIDLTNNMKTKLSILLATLCVAMSPALRAEDGHDHADHEGHEHAEKLVGPNEGRIITSVEPHIEFFVMPDRKVKITFIDDDGKVSPLKEQKVSGIGGDRSKPTRLAFAKDGESLVSDKPLPEGKMIPLILTVKVTPDAKSVNEKFTVNLADCPTCKHAEYACTCDHSHEGHDH